MSLHLLVPTKELNAILNKIKTFMNWQLIILPKHDLLQLNDAGENDGASCHWRRHSQRLRRRHQGRHSRCPTCRRGKSGRPSSSKTTPKTIKSSRKVEMNFSYRIFHKTTIFSSRNPHNLTNWGSQDSTETKTRGSTTPGGTTSFSSRKIHETTISSSQQTREGTNFSSRNFCDRRNRGDGSLGFVITVEAGSEITMTSTSHSLPAKTSKFRIHWRWSSTGSWRTRRSFTCPPWTPSASTRRTWTAGTNTINIFLLQLILWLFWCLDN